MKILFCIDSLTGGGAEKLLLRYIKILQKNFLCDITLFVINGYGALMNNVPSNITLYIGNNLTDSDMLRFNNTIFDIEIGFLEGLAIKFVALHNSSAIKIGWIHTDMRNNNWCRYYYKGDMQEVLYQSMHYIICVSEYCATQLCATFPSLKSKVKICNNILDFEELDKHLVKSKIESIMLEDIKICFIGRLTQEKHPDLLIPAIKQLRDSGYSISLYMLGEGYMFQELTHLIKINNLENSIHLLGYIQNPYEILSQCHLLVSMSDVEGNPLNIAEAYYLNIPIIASHSGGSDDFRMIFGGIKHTGKSVNDLVICITELFANDWLEYKVLKSQIIPTKLRKQFGDESLISLFQTLFKELNLLH